MKSRYVVLLVLLVPAAASAQELIPLASNGGVTLFSSPQESPGRGYKSARIVVKTDDPISKLSTIEGINIFGDVVQTWTSLIQGTPFNSAGALYDEDYVPFDTHMLFSRDQIGGGDFQFTETNDMSLDPIELKVLCNGCFEGLVGIGPTRIGPMDSLFLKPEFASSEIEVAQVISNGSASISIGVKGDENGPAAFFDSVPIVFEVPEPASLRLWLGSFLAIFSRRLMPCARTEY